jgi:cell division septal protein FtsQ
MREQYKLSMTQVYVLAIAMIAFLGIYYVWTLNLNATNGYNIRKLELSQREATFEENILDIYIAETESTNTISNHPSVKNMPAVEKVDFLVMQDSQFSFKE